MAGRITAITPQVKNPERLNIFLDDKFAFGLSEIVGIRLRVGQELSDEQIENLLHAETKEKAFLKACDLLNRKRYTVKEIHDKLIKAGFTEDNIEPTIERLTNLHLLNDQDYVVAWISFRNRNNPKGLPLLKMELRQKGISNEDIEAALTAEAELGSVNLDPTAAPLMNIARKCYDSKCANQANPWQAKKKFLEYLLRRGFSYGDINQAWTTITQEVADLAELTSDENDQLSAEDY